MVSAPLTGITVTKGEDKLTEYRFNTGTARHFFCSVCGIYTFISGVLIPMNTV
ncbi:glutathione-Dependent Formaldehyde-Activating GFA [Enterobacter cloacae]|uniref:Glutathione-Dependent Formaldehyde-Activating GFA n=1 Tax=Enterobacter cloacae TaxID=550 RepID=A0A377LZQ7_ENTCL|nr:glutathione-Dependent Formaldehyde-Activating GFA [Enterobacter cloacae]